VKERALAFWNEDEWKAITASWPQAVQRGFAKNLRIAQLGGTPQSHAKPLSGFKISVWELWHRDGQRVIYTTDLAELTNCVHILDAFSKDSRKGKKMRTSDKSRIEGRVKAVRAEIDRLSAEIQARRRTLH
jgi:phage-related protein